MFPFNYFGPVLQPPMAPNTCQVLGTLYDDFDAAISGTQVYYRLVAPPPISGLAYTGATKSVLTESNGTFSATVWQNAEYQFWVGSGERVTILTNQTNTSAAIAPGATILTVANSDGILAGTTLSIGPDGSGSMESVVVSAIAGTTLTISPTANAHASGAPVAATSIPCPPLIGGQTPAP
jgi:hypothetical protein